MPSPALDWTQMRSDALTISDPAGTPERSNCMRLRLTTGNVFHSHLSEQTYTLREVIPTCIVPAAQSVAVSGRIPQSCAAGAVIETWAAAAGAAPATAAAASAITP